MAHLICKNDEALHKAGVLGCQFDTPYRTYYYPTTWMTTANNALLSKVTTPGSSNSNSIVYSRVTQ